MVIPVRFRFFYAPSDDYPAMARLRLGYTKSRNGCLRCKQRRVKVSFRVSSFLLMRAPNSEQPADIPRLDVDDQCDENRPCKACVRHGIECSLVSGQAGAGSSLAASAPIGDIGPCPAAAHTLSAPSRPRPAIPNPKPPGEQVPDTVPSPDDSAVTAVESPFPAAGHDPFPYFAKFVSGEPEDSTANWVSDLELLHHFITSTVHDCALTDVMVRVWQVEVPKQAFTHVYLLHHMLSLAAYHLAYLCPQKRQEYLLCASRHRVRGIRGMRMALANIAAENCHALFAASCCLYICALAASPFPEPTIDDLVDVFLLVKGMGSVLFSFDASLRSGPISELFDDAGPAEPANPMLHRVVLALEDFSAQLDQAESDEGLRTTIRAEAGRLAAAIRHASRECQGAEYRVVSAWPILLPDSLVPLLRQRNQAALALLSYYCVVFHEAELQRWFMKGWTAGVMRDIEKAMSPPWNQHSAWAQGWIRSRINVGT